MTLDKYGRLSRANIVEGRGRSAGGREASAPPPYAPPYARGGCFNECYMAGDAASIAASMIDRPDGDGLYQRRNGKTSMVDSDAPVRRRADAKDKKKKSKDRNSLLTCMADCFCPLYSIKRDFVDYMYTPASHHDGHGKKTSETSAAGGTDFASNVNMESDNAYKGCYYFDNLAVDGQ